MRYLQTNPADVVALPEMPFCEEADRAKRTYPRNLPAFERSGERCMTDEVRGA